MIIVTKKPKGEYIIYREEPDKDGSRIVYSTNSIFWYCFFTDRPLPGSETPTCRKFGEKIDWSVVTYKGEIVHRFKYAKKDNLSSMPNSSPATSPAGSPATLPAPPILEGLQ